ncbi:MAG: PTS sugar transporter subunit IIA [Candidatus Zixiibacteriota bacterium]
MKLSIFCSHDLIKLDLKSETKEVVIRELIDLFDYASSVEDKEVVLKDLLEREKLGSTGVGLGIAFPHARSKAVNALTIAVGRSEKGVRFGSIDRKPVHIFIVVVSPENSHAQHLSVLASLSLLLHEKENIDKFLEASFPQEILDLLDK